MFNRKLNCEKPKIPEGYEYAGGIWYNGFCIERNLDKSSFIWIPTGALKENKLEEANNGIPKEILEKIEAAGGFYISQYKMSKDSEGNLKSVKDALPWIVFDAETAKEAAASFEPGKSYLTFDAAFDTIIDLLVENGDITKEEAEQDSTILGNYINSQYATKNVALTGQSGCSFNLFDIAGNVCDWTQEGIVRGGSFNFRGYEAPLASKRNLDNYDDGYLTGFRVMLVV